MTESSKPVLTLGLLDDQDRLLGRAEKVDVSVYGDVCETEIEVKVGGTFRRGLRIGVFVGSALVRTFTVRTGTVSVVKGQSVRMAWKGTL